MPNAKRARLADQHVRATDDFEAKFFSDERKCFGFSFTGSSSSSSNEPDPQLEQCTLSTHEDMTFLESIWWNGRCEFSHYQQHTYTSNAYQEHYPGSPWYDKHRRKDEYKGMDAYTILGKAAMKTGSLKQQKVLSMLLYINSGADDDPMEDVLHVMYSAVERSSLHLTFKRLPQEYLRPLRKQWKCKVRTLVSGTSTA